MKRVSILLAVLAACPPPDSDNSTTEPGSSGGPTSSTTEPPTPTGTEPAGTSETTSAVASTGTTAATAQSTSSSGSESTSTGEPLPPPVCGDGEIEEPEECDGGPNCDDCLLAQDYIAFVTGVIHTLRATDLGGGPGGMAGADAFCQALADESDLPGRYKAWLSTSMSSPLQRFTPSPGGYVTPHGDVIAESWEALRSGHLDHPIIVNADGSDGGGFGHEVWTSTTPKGELAGLTCDDWTDTGGLVQRGNSGAVDQRWTQWIEDGQDPTTTCREEHSLYCFRQNEDCVVRACVAASAACEYLGLTADCALVDDACGAGPDPCKTCFDISNACSLAGHPCPAARELCIDTETSCCDPNI